MSAVLCCVQPLLLAVPPHTSTRPPRDPTSATAQASASASVSLVSLPRNTGKINTRGGRRGTNSTGPCSGVFWGQGDRPPGSEKEHSCYEKWGPPAPRGWPVASGGPSWALSLTGLRAVCFSLHPAMSRSVCCLQLPHLLL